MEPPGDVIVSPSKEKVVVLQDYIPENSGFVEKAIISDVTWIEPVPLPQLTKLFWKDINEMSNEYVKCQQLFSKNTIFQGELELGVFFNI